jgi:hypothetical protein
MAKGWVEKVEMETGKGLRVKIEGKNMILFLETVVLNDSSFTVSDQNTL